MKAHALERPKSFSSFSFVYLICFYNSYHVIDGNIADVGAKLIIDENLGDLLLGKLRQEYILDVELREILRSAALDGEKMIPYKGQELFVITSIVCSEKFEVVGERKRQVCTLSSLSLWISISISTDCFQLRWMASSR